MDFIFHHESLIHFFSSVRAKQIPVGSNKNHKLRKIPIFHLILGFLDWILNEFVFVSSDFKF